MICTTAGPFYYPISVQRVEVIRGSARVRYVRGSLLVNAKYFLTDKPLNDLAPVSAALADPFLSREDASPALAEAH
jgi:hypothetical protein